MIEDVPQTFQQLVLDIIIMLGPIHYCKPSLIKVLRNNKPFFPFARYGV